MTALAVIPRIADAQTNAYPVLAFRADSANGSGPYPRPGAASPWTDLRGAHPGTLAGFDVTAASGWKGDGTSASPYRLEYSGLSERVSVPGGSVAELQTADPVTAAMWFRTSFDAPSTKIRYLLEWLDSGDHGMSIAVQDGHLRVWVNPWVDVATLAPDTWYHVAVAKTSDSLRVYVNGALVHAAAGSLLGIQTTPIGIGCSTYRFNEGDGTWDDFWNGSIAQVEIWRGALGDSAVTARYQADRALYPLTPPLPQPARVVELRGDQADGSGPYVSPGAGSPFTDLVAPSASAALLQFDGTAASGWQGSGATGDAHRLRFDGVNDVARIAPAAIAELQTAHALSAEMWMRTGPDVTTPQYWIEWLEAFGRAMGMSVGTENGQLQVYDGAPGWTPIAPVAPNTWYHVIVTKEPGAVRAYVNGARVFTGVHPNFGEPATELALGASIYRGAGQYGEHFHGEMGQASLWLGALDDAAALAAYRADTLRYGRYALTALAGPGGTVTPAGARIVPQHGSQSYTIAPATWHRIVDVVVDGVSVGPVPSHTFSDVIANHTLTASFARNAHTITASAGTGGAISPPGPVSVYEGTDATFTITPQPGYHVADVLVDGISLGAVTTHTFFTVTAPHTIAASFALNPLRTVTASAGPHGTITPSGAVQAPEGADLTFTLTPDAGWHVDSLVVDGAPVTPSTTWTFPALAADHTLRATFAIDTWTLALAVTGNGAATRTPDQASYDHGTPVTLTAAPDTGWAFAGWSGDTTASDNPLALTMLRNRSLTATFTILRYAVTASADSHGTVTPSGATLVDHGSDLTVAVTPDTGWHVADVLVDGVSAGPVSGHTFTHVTAPHTLHASFAINRYPVSATAGDHGTVAPAGTVDVPHGGAQVFTFQPDSGYHVADVVVDGASVGAPAAYTFTGVTGPHTLAVSFAIDVYTITATAGSHGSLAPAGAVPVTYRADQAFAITADAGWRIREVKVDGVPQGPVAAYTFAAVTGPHTIEATFSPEPVALVTLRADSATGTGPAPAPGGASPWHDVRNGHHATLQNFIGTLASGWNGSGTPASPRRLEFTGHEERAVIPPASVPELMSADPVTAAVWFQTDQDGNGDPARRYLLEWIEPSERGMAISMRQGHLGVFLGGWTDVATLAPHAWYHVAVAKEDDEVRVYVNGVRVFTAAGAFLGTQVTPIGIGTSVYRMTDGMPYPYWYGDYFSGAIGAVEIWRGALRDGEVLARFAADQAQYLPNPAPPAPARVVDFRAGLADGAQPPVIPGAQGPWKDLAGTANDGTLRHFDGTAASGWAGAGTPLDPWRLRFDGVDDVVTLPAASVAELQSPRFASVEMWMRTPSDIARQGFLLEWLESFARTTGMSMDVADSTLRVYLDQPGWATCARVEPGTWYHVVVAKQPGEVRAYLDGVRVFTAVTPHLGDQGTELVIGASTWRGAGGYGDFWAGDLGEVAVWNGALDDSAAAAAYLAGRARFVTWPLAASTGGTGGTITPSGTVRVPHGGSQSFAIAPLAGSVIADVLVDGVSVGRVTQYAFTNVAAPHAIYARFRAEDTVAPRVQVRDPNGGDTYGAGLRHLIYWRNSDLGGIQSVDVLYSLDNGATWLPIVTGVPDSGVCNWAVPLTKTTTARVKVVARDSTGNSGFDVSDGPFTITDVVVGVPEGDGRLALSGFVRNPATSDLRVTFTLPDASPARLELLDPGGRRVRARDVGGLGAGPHVVDLGDGERPAAGVYFLRLTHPRGVVSTKAVIVR